MQYTGSITGLTEGDARSFVEKHEDGTWTTILAGSWDSNRLHYHIWSNPIMCRFITPAEITY